uniref:Uncharacterized protein n=1 Tax=Arion vulgaris TaxID=1028688 RepID=A0A0B7APV2_9EUPU
MLSAHRCVEGTEEELEEVRAISLNQWYKILDPGTSFHLVILTCKIRHPSCIITHILAYLNSNWFASWIMPIQT